MIIVLHFYSRDVRTFADLFLVRNATSFTFLLHYATFIYSYYQIIILQSLFYFSHLTFVLIILGFIVSPRLFDKIFKATSSPKLPSPFHNPSTHCPHTIYLSFFIHRELLKYEITLNLFSQIVSIFLLAFFLCIYFLF